MSDKLPPPEHPTGCRCRTCVDGHTCHVPRCTKRCPPEHLMCGPHWKKVPRALQHEVWVHYTKGQELGLRRPTSDWFDAAKRAIEAVLRGDDGSGQVGLFEPGSESA